jgi:hypothetical protein
MRTTGTLLFAVQRCSSIRLRMAAHGGRDARGLLYLNAVPISGPRPRALSRPAGGAAHDGMVPSHPLLTTGRSMGDPRG